jgi:hypothetical protein
VGAFSDQLDSPFLTEELLWREQGDKDPAVTRLLLESPFAHISIPARDVEETESRDDEFFDDEDWDTETLSEQDDFESEGDPTAWSLESSASPKVAEQSAWILDINRSALDLLTDATTRDRYLNEVDWSRVAFPGNVAKSQRVTGELERQWRLADRLFAAMAAVVPERRVPHSIKYHDPVVVEVPGQPGHRLFAEASDAFLRMHGAAAADGVGLEIVSSWRSRTRQQSISRNQPNPNAAARGTSAHMYGLAVDLRMSVAGLSIAETNTRTSEMMANLVRMFRSPAYKWMALRGRGFGWYPYRREPWHWEYNPPGFKQRFESRRRPSRAAIEANEAWDGEIDLDWNSLALDEAIEQLDPEDDDGGSYEVDQHARDSEEGETDAQAEWALEDDEALQAIDDGGEKDNEAYDAESDFDPGTQYDQEPTDEVGATVSLREAIVAVALREWELWGRGTKLETSAAMRPHLTRYWSAVLKPSVIDEFIDDRKAWSAAFVSWVMKTAGAGDAFLANAYHTAYLDAAKRDRGNASKFQAFRIDEVALEVGDVVCKDRPRTGAACSGTTYDNAHIRYANGAWRSSHGDIVLEVDNTRHCARVIGGNVSQSVDDRWIRLTGDNRLPAAAKGGCAYIAVLKAPEVAASALATTYRPDASSLPLPGKTASTSAIRFAQHVLNRTESEQLQVDGRLGARTQSALERFRKKYGIGPGGVLDANTDLALAQRALEEIAQQSLFAQIGLHDTKFEQALIAFKAARGLAPDAALDAAARAALVNALKKFRSPSATPAPATADSQSATQGQKDWAHVSEAQRMAYVTGRLAKTYGYSVDSAAGIVGNLWEESKVLPNLIEGSNAGSPMRGKDFFGKRRDFSPVEIMNRDRHAKVGPVAPGIGLAQWTYPSRRRGLFQHKYQGRVLGSAVLFEMDAQVDYLVSELRTHFRAVDRLLRKPGTSLNAASDEVVYSFERPRSILDDDGKPLPRDDTRVQDRFKARRAAGHRALLAYRAMQEESNA